MLKVNWRIVLSGFAISLLMAVPASGVETLKSYDASSTENLAKGAIVELLKQMILCGDRTRFDCPDFNPGPAMSILLRDSLASRQTIVARRNLVALSSYFLGEEIAPDYNCLVQRQGSVLVKYLDESARQEKTDCERYAESLADPRSTAQILDNMCVSRDAAKAKLIMLKQAILKGNRCSHHQ
jgi:hypothetical protein